MGCDIHAHAEFKINGRWEHIKELIIQRDYSLFSRLVNGHSRGNKSGIAPERGFPKDINALTHYLLNDEDNHTSSYLDGNELKQLMPDDLVGHTFLSEDEYKYRFDEQLIFSGCFRLVFAFDN